MKKKRVRTRSDTRTVRIAGKDVEPILKRFSTSYSSDNLHEQLIEWAEDNNRHFDSEYRIKLFEDWAKKILSNNDLPTEIFTEEFNKAYNQKSPQPFDNIEFAKEALIQIRFLRDGIKNGDINKAIINSLNLGNLYSQYLIRAAERRILIGKRVEESRSIPKETISAWKAEASRYYSERTRKPGRNQIYKHVAEKLDAKLKTVSRHLKDHMNDLGVP